MADEVHDAARAAHAAGEPGVVVTITAHRGSVPRESGTRMLVLAGYVVGTIGGGHLELQAIERARAWLGTRPLALSLSKGRAEPVEAPSQALTQSIALGPSLGQCCGGALDLRYTLLADDDPALWPPPPPRFTLQLFGAGHVGRALVQVLAGVPCRVVWIDERESEFPPGEPPPHIRRVCVEPVEAEVAAAAPGDFYLVLTHSHDLDLRITQAILARGDFGFFGLIGSATKRAKFERRLAERGFAPGQVARMQCPIGLPGLRGKEPGVIAVAAVAQLLLAASASRQPPGAHSDLQNSSPSRSL
jgi:xanthine dehydrogenase accessory factor